MPQWKIVTLETLLTESKIESSNPSVLKRIRVRLNTNGVEKRPLTVEKTGATKYYTRKSGQFIYGRQNLHKGAFGIVPKELDGFESSSDMPAFDVCDQCLPEWIDLFLKQGNYYLELEKIASGVGSKRISPKRFLQLEIPLPPINEQRQIIEKSLLQLDKQKSLKYELDNQKDLLKKLRQQILQDAIEGKLTKDWREQNPDVEPASELLKRVQAEKQQLIKDKKIKKQKVLPAITDDEKPFELPESWTWCRLGEIITDTDSGWSPKCDGFPAKKGAWGVLKTTAVQRMEFVPSKNKSLPNGLSERPNIEVKKGDILITRAGPTNRVGICALVRKTPSRLMLSDKIIRFHPIEVYGEFIELFVGSGLFQELIKNFKTGMAESQVNISQLNLKRVLIPLLPISEQKSIVKKVEKLFVICDQLEEQINSSQTNADQLMQSVLKEAFSQGSAA